MQTEQKDQRQVDIESMFVDAMKKDMESLGGGTYPLALSKEDKWQKSDQNSS